MKLLIIGSEGFIGSNLFSAFHIDNTVFTADIINSASSERHFILNTLHPDYNSVFRKEQFDYCINASGSGNVSNSFKEIDVDLKLNSTNVFYLLNAIKIFNPECRFINFSSAAVYGNPKSLPVNENSEVNPVSPYGFHKYYSELICKEFYKLFGIQSCSLRVFSAYGKGLKKQLFWDIFQKGNKSNTIELFGTGNESRDFIFIDDIISAIKVIMESNYFKSDVINVASGEEITIKRAAEYFVKQMFENKTIAFTNVVNEGNPDNWRADITKLKSLGFTPKTTIEEGLKRYADWLKINFVK